MSIFGRASAREEILNAEILRPSGETGPSSPEASDTPLKIISRGTSRNVITLSPMKSLSLEEFNYPFASPSKIRDALKLQSMPFSAGGDFEIFPSVLSVTGRNSSGIAWFVPLKMLGSTPPRHKIWPAPLPLISKLKAYGGTGATIWADEGNISAIFWQSNRPVIYRWQKRTDDGSIQRIRKWLTEYSAEHNLQRGTDFVFFADGSGDISRPGLDDTAVTSEDPSEMPRIISESISICPWIAELNISRSEIEKTRDLQRNVRFLTKLSARAAIIAGIILISELLDYHSLNAETKAIQDRTEAIYRRTFEPERTGRISNPVTLARDKIASMTGKGDEGRPLDEVLADMGEVFSGLKDSKMAIDIIRYNAEGIDCTGTAPDMTAVLNFRRSWEDRAKLVQVDNTQLVSGIGYRFDIRIRW